MTAAWAAANRQARASGDGNGIAPYEGAGGMANSASRASGALSLFVAWLAYAQRLPRCPPTCLYEGEKLARRRYATRRGLLSSYEYGRKGVRA